MLTISKPDIRKVPIVHFQQHLGCQRIDVVLLDFCQISLVNKICSLASLELGTQFRI